MKQLLKQNQGFNPNEPPTGIACGAVEFSEYHNPQFFTFGVNVDGSLNMNGIE